MSDSKYELPRELYYIHLKNLPWSACHKDVLEFFDGIAIPPGGVSIYCSDAFVVVTNKMDFDKALEMNGKRIRGTTVYLTSSIKREIFQRKCQYISRKLQFSPSIRRIRPTFIPETAEDMFNVFNPVETDIPDENKEVYLQQPNQINPKKIRPTLLKDLKQVQIFDKPEKSSDGHCTKKVKLADDWLISHLEV